MEQPLMAHATAQWLVDNTALTFEQIAIFCGLHILEVQAIADDMAGVKLMGRDPVGSGELAQSEIDKASANPDYRMKLSAGPEQMRRTKGPRYTPVSKRAEKPDGVMWIVKNHPEVSDAQISKLIGTTKGTIGTIRDKSHWNSANIQPRDPVTLGLCSQRELDAMVAAAQKGRPVSDVVDPSIGLERDALIVELRAERVAAIAAAELAAAEAEAAERAEAEADAAALAEEEAEAALLAEGEADMDADAETLAADAEAMDGELSEEDADAAGLTVFDADDADGGDAGAALATDPFAEDEAEDEAEAEAEDADDADSARA